MQSVSSCQRRYSLLASVPFRQLCKPTHQLAHHLDTSDTAVELPVEDRRSSRADFTGAVVDLFNDAGASDDDAAATEALRREKDGRRAQREAISSDEGRGTMNVGERPIMTGTIDDACKR